LARANRLAQARGNSPRCGVSSRSAGRSASGSMPAWLISARRRGGPGARANFGRPIIGCAANSVKAEVVSGTGGRSQLPLSESAPLFVAGGHGGEPIANALHQLIANRAIGVEPLLAAAFGAGRVDRGPVFDVGGDRPRQVERLVMRLRRQG